tara:strand:+ start:224 stop:385 length:162 start_codon:yes stop_codon:yes gene_type:complete
MTPGTPDLIFLILLFIAIQAWWIIPIVKKNNKMNERGKELREEIKQLEKLYRK